MGDWNAKVGLAEEGEETTISKHPLSVGVRKDNRERFVNFWAMNDLVITLTVFPLKDIRKYTWTSPDGKYRNQIDHITINNKFRTYRGADAGNDHNLALATVGLKLCRVVRPNGKQKRYDVSKLKNQETGKEFVLERRNRLSWLKERRLHFGQRGQWR